jgi:hypothetical protein
MNFRLFRRVLLRLLPLTVLGIPGSFLRAQTAQVIDVNEARPLWYAMDALEDIVHSPINYEDPPYQNMADLVDYSTPEQRAGKPGYQLLGPPQARLTLGFQMPASGALSQGDIISQVNALLVAYRQQKLPGDFKVEQANGMIYITPIQVLGADGTVHEAVSPLATLITIPSASRNMADTVQAILDEVNKATGLQIVLGVAHFWPTQMVTFGASGVAARDALAALFAQASLSFSYRLNFDPIPDKMRTFDYTLNLRPVGSVAPGALIAPPVATAVPSGTAPGVSSKKTGQ